MIGIIEKLNSYQILTNLMPGAFFGLGIKFLFGLMLPTQNVGEEVITYYFMGLIINRIGSLVVEPILKKIGFVRFAPYSEYTKTEKLDSKIITLSEMNNYTRSLLTSVLIFPIIGVLQVVFAKWIWLSTGWRIWVIALLILLFLLTYRKQTEYVRKRIETNNSQ